MGQAAPKAAHIQSTVTHHSCSPSPASMAIMPHHRLNLDVTTRGHHTPRLRRAKAEHHCRRHRSGRICSRASKYYARNHFRTRNAQTRRRYHSQAFNSVKPSVVSSERLV
ncbi:uncharacterized protein K489DRAFT_230055 [Dissoconium aciculare CBS 342.82]|uniref:Uncharacterized protein n=1 Tax=Dissoconium aciculare CBS 342.82 TaxID=1314786 RepID=A0A6J3M1V7_9PEZI|nr:uncharacterized protein K489DRAFT_230055 [Dissoconium aciculare CBS 342.82]KAF1821996.1 hypothetical protein K489DRAFT_230055 [Dissoconium aciculare CBS 342.82]